jgi:restriction system protein
MARRRKSDFVDDLSQIVSGIIILSIVSFYFKYKDKIIEYRYIVLGLCLLIAALILFIIIKYNKRKNKAAMDYSGRENTLYLLRGMSDSQFEDEIAKMFNRLGYSAKAVGKSHDGGKDVVAIKNGKRYLIQCKQYKTKCKVGVKDVRELLGVISDENADGGYFVTTNRFTKEAWFGYKDSPKVQLIPAEKLVDLYIQSLENNK